MPGGDMPQQLGIERSLERAERSTGQPLFTKYLNLRHELFKQANYWAGAFPGGNDHGPEHVERVLEKLDQLVGGNPAKHQLLRPYELFLTMLSILYHDIGILRAREDHPEHSAIFVEEEKNEYLVDPRDRDIISAAVMSHSSSKDIALETERFADEELIGSQSVRPRVIAALVRLADELDEDFRRANPAAQDKLDLPEASVFFWQFCQRVRGIRPDLRSRSIDIDVRFEREDVGRTVLVKNRRRPFVSAFAEKLAKINRERIVVAPFLPEPLRYTQLKVSVKPLPRHKSWKRPRDFVFGDHTAASEFVAAVPELLIEPARQWLLDALRFLQEGKIDEAGASLERLREVGEDLPNDLRLRIFYDAACLESTKAGLATDEQQAEASLQRSLDNLSRWLRLGLDGAFEAEGLYPYNEIHRMARDGDLHELLTKRREEILQQLPEPYRKAVPAAPPAPVPLGGGGCLARGTPVVTPGGKVPAEALREGDEVLSISLGGAPTVLRSRIVRIGTRREPECVRVDDRCLVTPSQPVYAADGEIVLAGSLRPGLPLLGPGLSVQPVRQAQRVSGYFEVYALTTDHPTHNFVVDGFLVCHNKKYLDDPVY